MVTVVCIKAGPKYSHRYVNILHDAVRRHLSLPHRFVCATDDTTGIRRDIETVPLGEPHLKGWWHKLQLFKPSPPGPWGLSGRLLFLDLDVALVGEIDSIVLYRPDLPLVLCRDFIYPNSMNNSSVMLLTAGSRPEIWKQFSMTPDGWAKKFPGDQEFLYRFWPDIPTFPEKWIVSYKLSARQQLPMGSKIVAFHGKPKPSEIHVGWVPEIWVERQYELKQLEKIEKVESIENIEKVEKVEEVTV